MGCNPVEKIIGKWIEMGERQPFTPACFRMFQIEMLPKVWVFPRAREIRESVCFALVKSQEGVLMDFSHLCQNILRDTDRWKFEFI